MFQLFQAHTPSLPLKVATYGGTGAGVTDFAWRRSLLEDEMEFQIVSWSATDEQLRLTAIEPETLEATGHLLGPSQLQRRSLVRTRSHSISSGEVALDPDAPVPMSMEQEFDLLRPIPGVIIHKVAHALCFQPHSKSA